MAAVDGCRKEGDRVGPERQSRSLGVGQVGRDDGRAFCGRLRNGIGYAAGGACRREKERADFGGLHGRRFFAVKIRFLRIISYL